MYTVAEIAQKCGVSSQAIYKRINGKLSEALAGHIHKGDNGKTLIDEEGAAILCGGASPNTQAATVEPAQPDSPASGPTESDTPAAELLAVMQATISQLRAENAELRGQLETERAAARSQAERTLTLAERLADLTANSQVLLKQQQDAQGLPTQGGDYTAAHEVPYATQEPGLQPEQTQPQTPAQTAKKGLFERLFGK